MKWNSVVAWLLTTACLAVATPTIGAAQTTETATATAQKPVDLNTASAAELETLPGIGPALAARIIEYREQNGAFRKVEELMNVRGIGEKAFLNLRAQVSVVPPPSSAR